MGKGRSWFNAWYIPWIVTGMYIPLQNKWEFVNLVNDLFWEPWVSTIADTVIYEGVILFHAFVSHIYALSLPIQYSHVPLIWFDNVSYLTSSCLFCKAEISSVDQSCVTLCKLAACQASLLEKEMAAYSSILAWKIPWTEEPGRRQSMGSLRVRVRQDWATSVWLFTFMHWRRKWQPTPVFLPGESQGRGSLVAAVCGVAQSRTRLQRLSSSSRFVIVFLPRSKLLLNSWL